MENKKINFYEIYDYLYTPFWKTKTFIITISLLLAIGFGIVAYFIIKKYKQKRAKEKTLTPWEHALQELKKLAPDSYQTKDDFKIFYFTITSIIKNYFQQRFTFDITDKTDDESILYLKKKNFDSLIIEQLETVLQGSLLIKFANAKALREQAHKDLETIISIVEKTKQETPEKNK